MGVIKHCPRCGAEFTCNEEDKWHCRCFSVTLNTAARTFLAEHYEDCLCVKCLREIAAQHSA